MKIFLYSITLFALIFIPINDVLAQEKVITQSEFSVIKERANEQLFSKPYRIRVSVNEYSAITGLPISTESNVAEYLSRGLRRYVSSVKTELGVKRTETIWIDGKVYIKEGDNAWKESSGTSRGSGVGTGSGRIPTIGYIFKGRKTLNSQKS